MSDEKIEYLFSNLKDFMNDKFNQINDRFEEHEKQQKLDLENLEAKMNKRFKNLEAEINERFEKHEKQQKIDFENLEAKINERFEEHEEKQRVDFAKLEHVMYDRTRALFDAREVSLDKDKSLYKEIKSLERILDKHHCRITELESKII